MAVGGCFCGKIRVEFTGDPLGAGLCHCNDCRKLTGSLFTYNFVVKNEDLKVTGSPKELAKSADSGNHVRNYFCQDCGTPLYGRRTTPDGVIPPTAVVRAGIFDDIEVLNKYQPTAELYTTRRVCWLTPVEGSEQLAGMMVLPS